MTETSKSKVMDSSSCSGFLIFPKFDQKRAVNYIISQPEQKFNPKYTINTQYSIK